LDIRALQIHPANGFLLSPALLAECSRWITNQALYAGIGYFPEISVLDYDVIGLVEICQDIHYLPLGRERSLRRRDLEKGSVGRKL
jgi:hypothetical protein